MSTVVSKSKKPKSEYTAEDWMKKANDHHEYVVSLTHNALGQAKRAGDALRRARKLFSHGKWIPWVKEHFIASYPTAMNYILISKNWDKVIAVISYEPELSLNRALAILRGPSEQKKREPKPASQVKVLVQRIHAVLEVWGQEGEEYLNETLPSGLTRLDWWLERIAVEIHKATEKQNAKAA